MTDKLKEILDHIDVGLEASMEQLFTFLRFASVATDPAYNADCRKAAQWLVNYFTAMGLATKLYPTTGQPVVFATYVPPPKKHGQTPHILFYGHYDVQPADPLELWTSPPFEPRIGKSAAGRPCIVARGSGDNKGQLMTFTEACRTWLKAHGSLPFRLTVLIEGDEEGDSSHLDKFVAANKPLLKADVAVICDTGMWDDLTPAIVTSVRGIAADEVTITGPKLDLHSGYYGGAALNPLRLLSQILGGMFDAKGRITIPGFYKGVKNPSAKQRARMAKIPPRKSYMKAAGIKTLAGEVGFSELEQNWLRPTAEINGIWGGYMGPGAKTVIPSKAHAKLTFRLVTGQNPKNIQKFFRSFVKAQLPDGFKASFRGNAETAAASNVSDDSPWIAAAARALQAEWKKPAILKGAGGSIPVVESFKQHLGMDSVMAGFVRPDDGPHSPNEKYDVESYQRGMRSYARFIAEIEKENP